MERVYVGNLPPDIRIKDIDDFFRAFGKLVYIDVNHRANPVYALVQFDSARNAFNAVKARHGYDYEGYTLQLRLVENEVRKRREPTPPPPPPPMFSDFSSQSNRGGSNNGNSNNNNNRMTGNFANSNSYQTSSSNSQWSNMSQGMQQQNNRVNMPQQNMMDYQTNNRSNNMQQQNMMQYSFGGSGGGSGSVGRSNMSGNTNTNRSNMQQQFSNANRSNMQQQQQQFSNANRSNMQQQQPQYSNSSQRSSTQYSKSTNRSNMQQQQQQYSNSNRSNMQQQQQSQNMNNYSNMPQQNMMNNYSNSNYSNMSQPQLQQNNMNMMNYSNNGSSWNSGSGNNSNNMMNNNMGWNAAGNNMNNMNNYNNNNNMNNNNNNPPNNFIYNSNNDPYARPGFEDNFTHGLSGSGRKWFNRYIRKGFSPEMARNKALEHRTQPYQRENVNNNNNNNIDNNVVNPNPNDPTNVALETIGNTILSLLSTNPADNFNNDNQMMQPFSNWSGSGDNFQAGYNSNDMPGPSTSRGNMMSQSPVRGQQPRNRVSRQQYLKSLDILRKLRGKREQNAKDRLSKKYHTQIVRDYEQYEKSMSASSVNKPRAITTSSNPRNDRQIASIAAEGKSFTQLSIALRKKKQQLFIAAKRLSGDPNKRFGGAYKKRVRILTNEYGFEDLEAKALAVHPLDKLKLLMDLKAECDNALKNKQDSFSVVKKIGGNRSSKNEAYRNDIAFLKKHEKLKINDLSPRLKSTIRSCLIRIHKHEKELRKPLTKTKFIRLLSNKTGQKATTSTTKKTAETSKTKAAATNTKKEVEKKEENTTEKAQENKQVKAEGGDNKQEHAEKKEGK